MPSRGPNDVPTAPTAPGSYWDDATRALRNDGDGSWRRYCDDLHARLLARWLDVRPGSLVLKTDAFDESVGRGLAHHLAPHVVIGVDVSTEVLRSASHRWPGTGRLGRADVRRLPFGDRTIDAIVSNSTLDHFDTRGDISVALDECHRVLRPGGVAIVTLDNLQNPIVALRAILPHRVLRAMRLVPYRAGATTGLRRLVTMLRQAGFVVTDTDVIMHVPRVAAVAWCTRHDRSTATPEGSGRLHRRLLSWERFATWPTRRVTGHFVAVRAVRP